MGCTHACVGMMIEALLGTWTMHTATMFSACVVKFLDWHFERVTLVCILIVFNGVVGWLRLEPGTSFNAACPL